MSTTYPTEPERAAAASLCTFLTHAQLHMVAPKLPVLPLTPPSVTSPLLSLLSYATFPICPAHFLPPSATFPQLRERQSDNMAAMSRGAIDVYDSLFRDACPKFVTSTPPAYDQATTNTNQLVGVMMSRHDTYVHAGVRNTWPVGEHGTVHCHGGPLQHTLNGGYESFDLGYTRSPRPAQAPSSAPAPPARLLIHTRRRSARSSTRSCWRCAASRPCRSSSSTCCCTGRKAWTVEREGVQGAVC